MIVLQLGQIVKNGRWVTVGAHGFKRGTIEAEYGNGKKIKKFEWANWSALWQQTIYLSHR